jgi:hypothetical protein
MFIRPVWQPNQNADKGSTVLPDGSVHELAYVNYELLTLVLVNVADFFPDSKAHVFYSGAPVWTIDWCPVFVDDQPCE